MMEEIIAQEMALDSALMFVTGWSMWNSTLIDQEDGLDVDLVHLMRDVLFAPAVVFITTGKSI